MDLTFQVRFFIFFFFLFFHPSLRILPIYINIKWHTEIEAESKTERTTANREQNKNGTFWTVQALRTWHLLKTQTNHAWKYVFSFRFCEHFIFCGYFVAWPGLAWPGPQHNVFTVHCSCVCVYGLWDYRRRMEWNEFSLKSTYARTHIHTHIPNTYVRMVCVHIQKLNYVHRLLQIIIHLSFFTSLVHIRYSSFIQSADFTLRWPLQKNRPNSVRGKNEPNVGEREKKKRRKRQMRNRESNTQ